VGNSGLDWASPSKALFALIARLLLRFASQFGQLKSTQSSLVQCATAVSGGVWGDPLPFTGRALLTPSLLLRVRSTLLGLSTKSSNHDLRLSTAVMWKDLLAKLGILLLLMLAGLTRSTLCGWGGGQDPPSFRFTSPFVLVLLRIGMQMLEASMYV
jgi:hypothetical protein